MPTPTLRGALRGLPFFFTLLAATAPPPKVWRDQGYAAFRAGSFSDGGANTYVSRAGRIQTINRFDLNGDGFLDIVLNNTHGIAEKLDAVLYWGNGRDFDPRRSSPVPNNGSQWMTAGDLNGDGKPDLVVANYQNGTWDGMDSAVYWTGSEPGPGALPWTLAPFGSRTMLPARAAQKAAIADLNRDGFPDIVFASSAGFWEYRARMFASNETPSLIYWGGAGGFTSKRRTEIATIGASDVAAGDLNGDGWPDLAFANREDNGKFDVDSFVYYGSSEGFWPSRRTRLPTHQANSAAIGDINGDGWPDVAFANGAGPASFVYLNTAGTFDAKHRLELESSDARTILIQDVNRDGKADIFITNHQKAGNRSTDSSLYTGDASGFSTSRRLAFSVTGAWGAAIADLNGDGWKEIVVAGFQEYDSFDTPSYVFWNGPDGFGRNLRTPLLTSGAVGVTVADFNTDGHPDLLLASTTSGSRGFDPVYIYWGSLSGRYSPARRLELPAREAYESAAADLDDDGRVDLAIANMGENLRRQNELHIWWGQPGAIPFTPARRSAVASQTAMGVSVSDLDRDGYLDLIIANFDSLGDQGEGSLIYWGGPGGFAATDRTSIPTDGARAPAIADLNQDGHLDIVFGADRTKRGAMIYWGDGSRHYSPARRTLIEGADQTSSPKIADLNKDGLLDIVLPRSRQNGSRQVKTLILWGSTGHAYGIGNSTALSTEGTNNVSIGDLNGDGWLDLAAPSYTSGSSRATLSSVFWGGPQGFSDDRRLRLPTNSAAGSIISDFNHDGFNDLFFVCHRNEPDPGKPGSPGSHHTASFLYWGGPQGLSPERRLEVPGIGPHNDFGADPGNLFDRSPRFDFVSAPHACSGPPSHLSWKGRTPAGTSIRFQLRTAATREALASAPWLGPGGPKSYFVRPSALSLPPCQWMEYRAVLGTAQGINSPILESVEVQFR